MTNVFAQTSNDSSIPSNQTITGCGYAINGALFYTSSSCETQGLPTILSKAKGIPENVVNDILEYDLKEYRIMVFHGGLGFGIVHKGGHTPPLDPSKFCQYDNNGNFTPTLSDAQKNVLLDLNSSYSVSICPFTGTPTPVDNTPSSVTIRPSGSFSVMDLGKNSQPSNSTHSISSDSTMNNTKTKLSITEVISVHKKEGLSSPLKQLELGISAKNVQCKQDYVLVIKIGNGHSVCVKPQTSQKLVERGWGIIINSTTMNDTLNIANTNFTTNYTITNAKIISISWDKKSVSIIVNIQSIGDGDLLLTIPKKLIQYKDPRFPNLQANLQDNLPVVLNNGQQVDFKIIKTTSTNWTLSIPFKNRVSDIEIIGPHIL